MRETGELLKTGQRERDRLKVVHEGAGTFAATWAACAVGLGRMCHDPFDPQFGNARPIWVSVFGPASSVFHPGASVG